MQTKILNTYSNNNFHTLKKIMVSKQIRRLKGKKQVFSLIEPSGNVKYDYIHERLLHTMEVESIASEIINRICETRFKVELDASEIVIKLRFSQSLLDSISYAHDFGHTPFGHVGETALTDYMRGNNLFLSHHKRVLKKCQCMPIFKHNFYSAALLYRNFLGCSEDIIDGVLKHSSISKFNGEKVRSVYDFGSNDYLPKGLRNNKNYLQRDSAFTLEGQVVAIADEVAQMLSDIEDSKVVFQESFVDGGVKSAVLSAQSATLKEYLVSLRRFFVNEIVNNSVTIIQSYLNKNYHKGMAHIRFHTKVIDFGLQSKQVFCELEELRARFLHGNYVVKMQNATSYLIIYRLFDYYLGDIKRLFKNDRKSMDYISENFCKIRNASKYKKDKMTCQTKYESFIEYIAKDKDKVILSYLNNVIIPNRYILRTIDQGKEKELGILCNYIVKYYLNDYGKNDVLDILSRSLLREISFSIAKMTDRYAINLFYKTFGKRFVKHKMSAFVKMSCKDRIVTKQFELNSHVAKGVVERLIFLKKRQ